MRTDVARPKQGSWGALGTVLYWSLPPLVCLLVFRLGLRSWFVQDDFDWLRLKIYSWSDLWRILTQPMAQGTLRPFSERFLFITFHHFFGLHPFPYRLFVFLVQFANLMLLTALARRITGSRWAGLIAATVWTVNIALIVPLHWNSNFYQVACALCYLASFLLFLRHMETGRWSYYYWQCGVFLFGFGVMEIIVMYPLVLLAYCLLAARRHAWKALPLFAPAAAYTAVHLWVIPRVATGPYVLHMDRSIFRTLGRYWMLVLGPVRYFADFHPTRMFWGRLLGSLLTAGLLAGLARGAKLDRRMALFGLSWFLLTLAPVLPLRDHFFDSYLAVPAIGLALAVAALAHSAPVWASAAWLSIYFGYMIPTVENASRHFYHRSHVARRLVQGVRQARANHPDQTILLAGVTDFVFYAAIHDRGPLAAGVTDVYLTPDTQGITAIPWFPSPETFQLPVITTLAALREGRAVVYEVSERGLKNITNSYRSRAHVLKPAPLRRIIVGEPLMSSQLGSGWYNVQQGIRWMGRRAEVRLAGPRSTADRLRIEAHYPDGLNVGVLRLTVSINGVPIGRAEIRNSESAEPVFSLPPSAVGMDEMTVTLELDRTFRVPTDARDLGLALGVVELI